MMPQLHRIAGRSPLIADRYQLLERIGEGGMGVVWRAYDRDLEEVVAIKFLREDLAGDHRRRACFRREARLARQVTHPNVARVFEFGRDRDLYFLTMEFVAGPSLHTILMRHGPLAPPKVYRRALGLCRGLAAAHAAGIVHGDIKPGNILISPQRGAVLTDFGIARMLSEGMTHDESVGGTPLYMAPEQILGRELILQSDVYAAGVVLFEALTGRLPWQATELTDLLAAKCGSDPDLSACLAGLPNGWLRLISRCISNDPAVRPADGRALLIQLHEIGGGADSIVDRRRIHTGVKSAVEPVTEPRRIGDTLPLLHGPRLHDEAAMPVNRPRSRPLTGTFVAEPDPITLVRAAVRTTAAPPVAAMPAAQPQSPRLPERRLDIAPRELADVQLWRVGVASLGMPAQRVARGLVDGELVELCCGAHSPSHVISARADHAAGVLVTRQGVADRLRVSAWARIPGRWGQAFMSSDAGMFRAACAFDPVAAPVTV